MDRRERVRRMESKEDLMDLIKSVAGKEPAGVRHILTLLTHEDIVDAAVDYLNGSRRLNHRCTIYTEGGWSCIQEYEAKTETIWSPRHIAEDEAFGTPYHEDWCDNCRQRHLSGDDSLG